MIDSYISYCFILKLNVIPSSLYRELKFSVFVVWVFFFLHTILPLLLFLATPFFLLPLFSQTSKIALASWFHAGALNASALWEAGKAKCVRGFPLELARLVGEQVYSLQFKILCCSFLAFSVEYCWMAWEQSIFQSSEIHFMQVVD